MSLMVPGDSLTTKAEKLKSWGYEGIAVFMEYSSWNDAVFNEIDSLNRRTGVIPCEFILMDALYGHLMDPNLNVREKSRAMYRETIRVCGEIGAVTELEYSLGPQDPLPLFHPYAKMSEDDENRFVELYEELAEPIRGTDGYLLLEPINRYESPFLNSLDDCMQILSRIDNPNTGLLPDTFHLSIEERSVPDALRKAGSMVRHVHLGDNNRLLPGQGNIDWRTCVASLRESRYSRFLNLECAVPGDPEVKLPEAAKFLRAQLESN
jgi:sugar phosphate isomerase/epimerase